MPQRTRMMHNDALHLPITTGSAFVIYGWTMQDIVLGLWAAYVVIQIVAKIPELAIAITKIRNCVLRSWRKIKGRKRGSKN